MLEPLRAPPRYGKFSGGHTAAVLVEVLEVGPVLKFHASGTQQPVPACYDSSLLTWRASCQKATATPHSPTPTPQGPARVGQLATANFREFFLGEVRAY